MDNLASFWNTKAVGQTVLPLTRRLILVDQKLVENAEIE